MEASSSLLCARCGALLRTSFTGSTCPRCLVASATAPTDPADLAEEAGHDTQAHPPGSAEEPPEWQSGAYPKLGGFDLVDILRRCGMTVVYLVRLGTDGSASPLNGVILRCQPISVHQIGI